MTGTARCGGNRFEEGQTVDAAIAEVATLNGSSRKDLKNFRSLNRGLADATSMNLYKLGLSWFEKMTKTEIMSQLDRMQVMDDKDKLEILTQAAAILEAMIALVELGAPREKSSH